MAQPPLVIKLRCTSWGQLAHLYEGDLQRNTLFLRTRNPPVLGREMRVEIVLPSGELVALDGRVAHHLNDGIELVLARVPPSTAWLIESALARAKHDARIAGHVVATAEGEMAATLEAELSAYRTMSAHQVLGLGVDGSEVAARVAYDELSKRYHPDRYAPYRSARLQSLANEISGVLRDAYRQVARGTPSRGVAALRQTDRAPGLNAQDLFGDLEEVADEIAAPVTGSGTGREPSASTVADRERGKGFLSRFLRKGT